MAAIEKANHGHALAYGDDDVTRECEQRFAELFDADVSMRLAFNGTGANILGLASALGSLPGPHHAVVCTDWAHIHLDETGAPERALGTKLVPLPCPDAKLTADRLAALPFVQPSLVRLGGVRACPENAHRLLAAGRRVIAFPEGARGATKLFRDRYRLQRFARGGVVRVALETRTPLVPVGVVGAEAAHPLLFKTHGLARAVGLSFLPVTPTFPLLGPFGLVPLPAKWAIRVGDPLALGDVPPDAEHDEVLVSRLTEELRSRMQELVDRALSDRESIWG